MIRYNSFEKFTISSKPVTADYIHAGVFVPVLTYAQAVDRFTFHPLGNTATKLAYWDEEAFASELVISSGSPNALAEGQSKSATDEASAATENGGLVKPTKDADAKAKKRKADSNSASKPKKVQGKIDVFGVV